MSELRKDPVVERWVIISGGSQQCHEIPVKTAETKDHELCPFCPGNEHLCPPEILANRPPDSHPDDARWNLRVVPNRVPVLVVEEELIKSGEGLYDKISGIGANEVIIETNRHTLRQSEMEIKELETIFWAYRDRMIDLENDRRIRYVHIYRNQGCQAGSTIDHPYSVLMALPIIPQTLQEELDGARRHFEYKSRCVYCDIIRQEIQHKERIIIETRHFVAFQAFAPRQPFETWILPKRHSAMFPEVEPGEIRDLAKIFKDVFSRLDAALNFPDYNYVIHTAPFGVACREFYHWHLEILPRVSRPSGCEWGSGVYINSTPPEEAAQYLRDL